MPTRYIVAEGQSFTYPADPVSLRTIKDNNGLSNMTEEDKRKLKFKTVSSGEDCSDLPQPAFGVYLERGWILEAKAEQAKDGD